MSEVDATAVADGTAEPGDYCRVQVRDSGSGMSEETKARLFDPYFTTKTMGRGLGLSSVIGIVRSRDGFVEVQSQPGQGCCFAVYLKLARHVAVSDSPEDSIIAQAPKLIKHESKAAPQVLLVDDEQMLLDMQTQYLSLSGMGVLTAKSAEEALEVANTNFSTLDCVVTDFCMSGKDGHWLAEQIRMKHPHIPVILCSGLVDGSLEAESDLYSVLAKPFSSKTLEALIRERVSQTNQRQQSAHDLAS